MKKRLWLVALTVTLLFACLIFSNEEHAKPRLHNSLHSPQPASSGKILAKIRMAHVQGIPRAEPSVIAVEDSSSAERKNCSERIMAATAGRYTPESLSMSTRIVGDWYFDSGTASQSRPESAIQGRFLLALALGGLLEGKSLDRNDDEALRLLSEVSEQDPSNSAPLLYAAAIEERRGNHTRAEELLASARSAHHFDSYLKDMVQSIFELVRSEEDLIMAYSVWSRAPVPNYLELRKLLKQTKDAPFFARQMLSDGLNSGEILPDLDWVPIEYAIGKRILDDAGQGSFFPDFRRLLKERSSQLSIDTDQVFASLHTDCDLSILSPLVTRIQDHLDSKRDND